MLVNTYAGRLLSIRGYLVRFSVVREVVGSGVFGSTEVVVSIRLESIQVGADSEILACDLGVRTLCDEYQTKPMCSHFVDEIHEYYLCGFYFKMCIRCGQYCISSKFVSVWCLI